MPLLVSRATGNFTAAATWGVADSATGSQLTAPTATTTTTTSYVYSSTFTGTNTKVADGVALFLIRASTTGTFTVALSDDNGATATRSVTVNAGDLPAAESWVFFKFGTTLTLDGGTDYRVGILGSSAGNVTVYRDATAGNWARIISTTDTAAPAAGDTMLIVGELTGAGTSNSYTVTMNNTATTDFGNGTATATAPVQTLPQNFNGIQVGNKGTMTWGTAAATAYYLKLSGNLIVWDGGTYNMGTSGTPCPRNSSMYLQFDCAAAGDFGACFMGNSTVNIYGQSRTSGKDIVWCRLAANAAANATSLTVSADTGWLDNDEIAIASTSRTATECENGALNGAAGASTLTVDGFAGTAGGLAFAHSGVSPAQAEIILLTRNVRISGATSAFVAYCLVLDVSVCTFRWAELFWLGANVGNKRPVSVNSTSATSTFDMQYCCVRDTANGGVFQNATITSANINIAYNTFWRLNTGNTVTSINFNKTSAATTVSFTDNVVLLPTANGSNVGRINFSRNIIAGATTTGATISGTLPLQAFDDNVFHSCGSSGAQITRGSGQLIFSISNLTIWRCASVGVLINNSTSDITSTSISGGVFFGNTTNNIQSNMQAGILNLNNCTLSGDTSFSVTNGLALAGSSSGATINISNSTFGVSSGILTNHTNDINLASGSANVLTTQMSLQNTILASPTEIGSTNLISNSGSIRSSKHDQTAGAFRSWFQGGRIDRDTTIFNTASPSERLTPSSASVKLPSGSRVVAVDNGTTITINAYVRKSVAGDGAAYNGNQPRLILKANPSCGINSDTVLATMSAAAGSWQQLTGTTATVNSDGALEFVVDCDGTTGWVNVDDWTVS